MRKLFILSALFLGFAALAPAYAQNADAVLGTWTTQSGNARVQIYKCGSNYCGKIVWLREPNYPAGDAMAGQPKVDRENPDQSKRTRPIMGLNLVWGFSYDDGEWSGGRIYNPEEGKTYSCTLTLESPNRLKVRGYIGVSLIGKTQYWTR
ncbi:MAG: DUF2147 domain-containing protein [Leptospirales bacterium]|nr:DUF2147 domain-containing protein [Leptospirales bacterium]